jgi:hypothetical protein
VDVLQTRQQMANAKPTQGVVAWEFGDVQGHGVALVVWRRTADWGAGTLKNDLILRHRRGSLGLR